MVSPVDNNALASAYALAATGVDPATWNGGQHTAAWDMSGATLESGEPGYPDGAVDASYDMSVWFSWTPAPGALTAPWIFYLSAIFGPATSGDLVAAVYGTNVASPAFTDLTFIQNHTFGTFGSTTSYAAAGDSYLDSNIDSSASPFTYYYLQVLTKSAAPFTDFLVDYTSPYPLTLSPFTTPGISGSAFGSGTFSSLPFAPPVSHGVARTGAPVLDNPSVSSGPFVSPTATGKATPCPAHPLIPGNPIPGDYYIDPIVMDGSRANNGSYTREWVSAGVPYTVEADEPTYSGMWATYWVTWDKPGVVTVQPRSQEHDGNFQIDSMVGESLDDLESVATLSATHVDGRILVHEVLPLQRSVLRFATSKTPHAQAGLTWRFGFIPLIQELQFSIQTTGVDRTPTGVYVSLLNGIPSGVVRFTVRGVSGWYRDKSLDWDGKLTGVSIPLPALEAGTYTLICTPQGAIPDGYASTPGEGSFTVARDPLPSPGPPPADREPHLVTQSGDVVHWVWQDLTLDGLGDWVMTHNPDYMSSPVAPRYITPEHTTAASGQWLLWEGAPRAIPWKFSGQFATEADYNQMLAFTGDKTKRFYIIDHYNRAWGVSFDSCTFTPIRDANAFWRQAYEVNCQIYRCVQL